MTHVSKAVSVPLLRLVLLGGACAAAWSAFPYAAWAESPSVEVNLMALRPLQESRGQGDVPAFKPTPKPTSVIKPVASPPPAPMPVVPAPVSIAPPLVVEAKPQPLVTPPPRIAPVRVESPPVTPPVVAPRQLPSAPIEAPKADEKPPRNKVVPPVAVPAPVPIAPLPIPKIAPKPIEPAVAAPLPRKAEPPIPKRVETPDIQEVPPSLRRVPSEQPSETELKPAQKPAIPTMSLPGENPLALPAPLPKPATEKTVEKIAPLSPLPVEASASLQKSKTVAKPPGMTEQPTIAPLPEEAKGLPPSVVQRIGKDFHAEPKQQGILKDTKFIRNPVEEAELAKADQAVREKTTISSSVPKLETIQSSAPKQMQLPTAPSEPIPAEKTEKTPEAAQATAQGTSQVPGNVSPHATPPAKDLTVPPLPPAIIPPRLGSETLTASRPVLEIVPKLEEKSQEKPSVPPAPLVPKSASAPVKEPKPATEEIVKKPTAVLPMPMPPEMAVRAKEPRKDEKTPAKLAAVVEAVPPKTEIAKPAEVKTELAKTPVKETSEAPASDKEAKVTQEVKPSIALPPPLALPVSPPHAGQPTELPKPPVSLPKEAKETKPEAEAREKEQPVIKAEPKVEAKTEKPSIPATKEPTKEPKPAEKTTVPAAELATNKPAVLEKPPVPTLPKLPLEPETKPTRPALPSLTPIIGEKQLSTAEIMQPKDGIEAKSLGSASSERDPVTSALPKFPTGNDRLLAKNEVPTLPALPLPPVKVASEQPLPPVPVKEAVKKVETKKEVVKKEENTSAKSAEVKTEPSKETTKEVKPAADAAKSVAGGKPARSIGFAKDQSDLSADAKSDLADIAEKVKKGGGSARIVAYASGSAEQGPQARKLSLARALQVRAFLISKGVNPLNINVQALGSQIPSGDGDRADVFVK